MKKVALVFAALLSGIACNQDDGGPASPPDDLPDVSLATFTASTTLTHPFFGPLTPGIVYVYEAGAVGQTPDEVIRIEIRASTKTVMGIACAIQHDAVYKDGILIEDTDDWLAQDDAGNLWYFGEFVKNYNDAGAFEDNEGSWESGVEGALPGYWLPIDAITGQSYHQEFWAHEAEDYAEVLGTDETVTIGLGTYEHCLKTKDVNPMEIDQYGIKYYAPGVGFIKEEKYDKGVLVEVEELVEIIG